MIHTNCVLSIGLLEPLKQVLGAPQPQHQEVFSAVADWCEERGVDEIWDITGDHEDAHKEMKNFKEMLSERAGLKPIRINKVVRLMQVPTARMASQLSHR